MKLLIVFLVFPMLMHAKVINVCADCTAKSAEQAVKIAIRGDVIHFKKGVHQVQKLVINTPNITIEGEPGAALDGGGQTILYPHADSITIRNLLFQNVQTNYVEDRAAIKANGAEYIHIYNVTVRECFFGILLEKCNNGQVVDCSVIGRSDEKSYLEASNGNAIHLWYCKDMLVEGNTLKKHRDGIYFEFVQNSMIVNNLSEGNLRYGLHFMFSNNNSYVENVFKGNGAGVAVMYTHHVKMIGNTFIDNWGESSYGLLFKDITDSELRDNVFVNNTIAISADNAMRVTVTNNRFEKNGYALRILGNCMNNQFTKNDFLHNSFDVTTNANKDYNDFNGNYWQDYTGYDLDRDGIGDVPFRPVKLFTYIIAKSPTSIILMRSTFIDLLNLAEKVTPVLTPENLIDNKPSMQSFNDHIKPSI